MELKSRTRGARLKHAIENCQLKKLSKNFDETENHAEYDIRKNNLDSNITILRSLIYDLKLDDSIATDVISSLLILYIELQDKQLNTEKYYWKLLNSDFHLLYGLQLNNVLQTDNNFNTQDIFDLCLEKLHSKLTSQEFKQYPNLIDVYCIFISKIKDYKVKINPSKIFPISLLLIDDYIKGNKIKGLTCCHQILQCLSANDFGNVNYHEVINQSLINLLMSKNCSNIKLLLDCLIEYLRVLPIDVKPNKTSDVFSKVLDEMYLESKIHRKVHFLECITKLIELHGVNSVKEKKKIHAILTENLDQCKVDDIRAILLESLLQCFKVWLQNCWCVWCYDTDWKLLSLLLLMNCMLSDKNLLKELQSLIVTLVRLSESDERKEVISCIETSSKQNDKIKEKMKYIIKALKHK